MSNHDDFNTMTKFQVARGTNGAPPLLHCLLHNVNSWASQLNLMDPDEGDVLGCSQVTENGRVLCKNYRLSTTSLYDLTGLCSNKNFAHSNFSLKNQKRFALRNSFQRWLLQNTLRKTPCPRIFYFLSLSVPLSRKYCVILSNGWLENSWSILFEGFSNEWFIIFGGFSILGKSLLSVRCLSFNQQLMARGLELTSWLEFFTRPLPWPLYDPDSVGINSDSWWKAIGLQNVEDKCNSLVEQWLRSSASSPKEVGSNPTQGRYYEMDF